MWNSAGRNAQLFLDRSKVLGSKKTICINIGWQNPN